MAGPGLAPDQSPVSSSPGQAVNGSPSARHGPCDPRGPVGRLARAGLSGRIWDLSGRVRWHRATLPGPQVSRCRLHDLGPSPWRSRGVTGGSSRAESRPRRAGALNKAAQRSYPSGARAVLRAQGPAPGIPVSPGDAPHRHAQLEGRPMSGPWTFPVQGLACGARLGSGL